MFQCLIYPPSERFSPTIAANKIQRPTVSLYAEKERPWNTQMSPSNTSKINEPQRREGKGGGKDIMEAEDQENTIL